MACPHRQRHGPGVLSVWLILTVTILPFITSASPQHLEDIISEKRRLEDTSATDTDTTATDGDSATVNDVSANATDAGCRNDWLGDGWCDAVNNDATCEYDGGDCCMGSCTTVRTFNCGSNGFACMDPTYANNPEEEADDCLDNQYPVAIAGPDFEFIKTRDNLAVFAGGSSFDPNGDGLVFKWSLTEKPTGSSLTDFSIESGYTPTARFAPDVTGNYTFTLTVSDECKTTDSDTFVLTVKCNTAPVAIISPGDAEDSAIINRRGLTRVLLDASPSTDPDDTELTYAWELISQGEATDAGQMSAKDKPKVWFTPAEAASYAFQVTVSDGCSSESAQVEVVVSNCNEAPSAVVVANQTVTGTFTTITLDAANSTDPDGDDISIVWALLDKPEGSKLSNEDLTADDTTQLTSFVADVAGSYTFKCIVSDGCSTSSAEHSVIVIGCSKAPHIILPNSVVGRGTYNPVVLNATGTHDPEGNNLTYTWTIKQKPDFSRLSDEDFTNSSEVAQFVPDIEGKYIFQLVVSDQCSESSAKVVVNIGYCNIPPVANSGPDKVVRGPDAIVLDASRSYDQDGEDVTFQWSLKSAPTTSNLTQDYVTNNTTTTEATYTFQPDAVGNYIWNVGVSDGCSYNVDPISVVVLSLCPPGPKAVAPLDQLVSAGEWISLDGRSLYNGDEALSYSWTDNSNGTTVEGQSVQWYIDTDGVRVLTFTVTDGCSSSSANVTITAFPVASDDDSTTVDASCSETPRADAGGMRTGGTGDNITLSAALTVDRDTPAENLTYTWSFTSKPSTSTAQIADPSSIATYIVPDVAGLWVFKVTVSDGCSEDSATFLASITEVANTTSALLSMHSTTSNTSGMDYRYLIVLAGACVATAVLVAAALRSSGFVRRSGSVPSDDTIIVQV